jgi:hypothetical protein
LRRFAAPHVSAHRIQDRRGNGRACPRRNITTVGAEQSGSRRFATQVEGYSQPMFHFTLVPQLKLLLLKLTMPFSNFGITSGTDGRGLPDARSPVVAERGVLGASTFAAAKERHQVFVFLVKRRSISHIVSAQMRHRRQC